MNSNIRRDVVNAFSCIALHAIHGTWYTWRVHYPFIIENAANAARLDRDSRRSGRIEKRAAKASEIQGQPQLSTYLPTRVTFI